jgi:hypothetical protein
MAFEKSESRNGKSTATDHIDPRTTTTTQREPVKSRRAAERRSHCSLFDQKDLKRLSLKKRLDSARWTRNNSVTHRFVLPGHEPCLFFPGHGPPPHHGNDGRGLVTCASRSRSFCPCRKCWTTSSPPPQKHTRLSSIATPPLARRGCPPRTSNIVVNNFV